MIDAKNFIDRENLEDLAQLSVIFSLGAEDSAMIREVLDPVMCGKDAPDEARLISADLDILFTRAGSSIDTLKELNSCMVELFDSNFPLHAAPVINCTFLYSLA